MAEQWKCFHCDEVFTDRDRAANHFGSRNHDAPLCCADQFELVETRKERDRYGDDRVQALRLMNNWREAATRAATIKINPMDWEETYMVRGDGQHEVSGWEASNGFGGIYRVEMYFGSDSFGFKAEIDGADIGDFDDPDAAKQCAQQHFEKQIHAALNIQQRASE